MSRTFDAALYNFRKKCPFIEKNLLHWFPGHMNKGMKQIQQKLKTVDCLIEVHDSRIPFSGRHPMYSKTLLDAKPHILVLNKKDLVSPSVKSKVVEKLKNDENVKHVVYTNCKDQSCKGVKCLVPLMVDLIQKSERFNRSEEKEFNVMVLGVPNVGKSSLINMLRSQNIRGRHSMPVGAVAGVTRSVMMKMKISHKPPIFILDTPGILEPRVANIEMGLKLALCASLQDHLVGEENIADYLLYWMNKNRKFSYVDFMGLTEPCDEINRVLLSGAVKYQKIRVARQFDGKVLEIPDLMLSARVFLKAFRSGELGKFFLDGEYLNKEKFLLDNDSNEIA